MAREYPGVYEYETKAGTRWMCSYRDSDGMQSTSRGYASAQAAAKAKARLDVRAEGGGLHLGAPTFAAYWETWLTGKRPFIDAGTYADYANHGRKRLIPEFGQLRIDRIATQDVRAWLGEMAEAGVYAPKTLNNALGAMVVCLNEATADRLLHVNPAAGVKRLPKAHLERDYLRIDEIDLYLSCCAPIYRPLAELLISCGLRISEALGLVWDDVDFLRGTLTVSRQSKGGDAVSATKGRRERGVDMGPDLVKTLMDLKVARAKQTDEDLRFAAVFVMPTRTGFRDKGVWASADSQRMHRNKVGGDWHKAALQDAGLRDMPLHALRHTAAATWLYCQQPMFYVQQQLGHASITTTQLFYAHLERSFMRTAARDTEAMVREAGRLRLGHRDSPQR